MMAHSSLTTWASEQQEREKREEIHKKHKQEYNENSASEGQDSSDVVKEDNEVDYAQGGDQIPQEVCTPATKVYIPSGFRECYRLHEGAYLRDKKDHFSLFPFCGMVPYLAI